MITFMNSIQKWQLVYFICFFEILKQTYKNGVPVFKLIIGHSMFFKIIIIRFFEIHEIQLLLKFNIE